MKNYPLIKLAMVLINLATFVQTITISYLMEYLLHYERAVNNTILQAFFG